MEPSKVYFCDLHTHLGDGLPNKLKRLIKKAGIGQIDFANKYVAIKMNLGEPGNLSYLRPNYARAVADVVRNDPGFISWMLSRDFTYDTKNVVNRIRLREAYKNK